MKSVTPSATSVSRTARMLALAHYIERFIENGGVNNYAEVARRLGIIRARVTQISNLLNLSPRLQEAILSGELEVSERRLRLVVKCANWDTLISMAAISPR